MKHISELKEHVEGLESCYDFSALLSFEDDCLVIYRLETDWEDFEFIEVDRIEL